MTILPPAEVEALAAEMVAAAIADPRLNPLANSWAARVRAMSYQLAEYREAVRDSLRALDRSARHSTVCTSGNVRAALETEEPRKYVCTCWREPLLARLRALAERDKESAT